MWVTAIACFHPVKLHRHKKGIQAAFLAAAALTSRAVSAGSQHFDPFKGASGVQLATLWSDVYDRVVPCMSATAASKLGAELTAAMVVDVLPGFAHSVSAEFRTFSIC